jgi:predicted ATPase
MTGSLSQLRIPSNVQAILASRIDRLPADEKELLQTLATIGNEFQLRLVTEVTGWPESVITPMLAELEKSEFVFEQLIADDIQYSFKHVLTRDVAASLMLTEKRKSLHERTAQAIEALFAKRLDAYINELAHHYQHSANVAKAVHYLTLVGQQASQRSAYLEAISNLNLGLDLLKKLPETPERDRRELALQTALGPSLMEAKGDASPETGAAYTRGAELSQKLGETSGLFWSQGGLFLSCMVGGQLLTAHGIAKHLLDMAQASNDRESALRRARVLRDSRILAE